MTESSFWNYRQQRRVSEITEITPSHINDIFHRRRKVSYDRAKLLSDAVKEITNRRIPIDTFMNSFTTTHAAFFGDPKN